MAVAVTASVLRTGLGDGAATFAALLAGRHGAAPLAAAAPIGWGYPIADPDPDPEFRAGRWLAAVVAEAAAGLDLETQRVDCLVGTGLGETATLEAYADRLDALPRERLDFEATVRRALPGVREVTTLSNACAAAGHALALAQDRLDAGEADAVVVAGVDAMSTSMLAMIGRAGDPATDRVRPFDRDRTGVLLGEGAGAVVLTARPDGPVLGRLLATGLSCDAFHETAPSAAGIRRAINDAYARAGLDPDDVALLVTHGTGTALNDPTEAATMTGFFEEHRARPLVTAVKGSIGHLSGAAALANLDLALRCLAGAPVPPVVGLRRPIDEAADLRLVLDGPSDWTGGAVQLNAFGFGGVNAVSLVSGP